MSSLTEPQRALLACIAGHMIPACSERGMPGADDDAIMAAVDGALQRDLPALRDALASITALPGFVGADQAAQAALLEDWRQAHPAHATVLEMLIGRAYYQDYRIRAAIGMEPRPPYPKGYQVEAGDLSLLEPVRDRGRIYRMPDGSDDPG